MSGEVSEENSYRLPCEDAMKAAVKIAMVDDKPIMLDYWTLSLDGKIIIGVKENGEKMGIASNTRQVKLIAPKALLENPV